MGRRRIFGVNSAHISSDQETVVFHITIGPKGFMNKVLLSSVNVTTAQSKENSTLGILSDLAGETKFE